MKKQHIRTTNDVNRKEICDILQAIMSMDFNDRELLTELSDLNIQMKGLSSSESASVIDIDTKIKTVLNDVKKDVQSSSFGAAKAKLQKVKIFINDRGEYCKFNPDFMSKQQKKELKIRDKINAKRAKIIQKRLKRGQSCADLYTPEELLDNMLLQAIDELAKYQGELKVLHDKLIENQADIYASINWETTKTKIKSAKNKIDMLRTELNRETLLEAIKQMESYQKELIAKRQVSDAEFNVVINKYNSLQKAVQSEREAVVDVVVNFQKGNLINSNDDKHSHSSKESKSKSASIDPQIINDSSSEYGKEIVVCDIKTTSSIFDDPEFKKLGSREDHSNKELLKNITQITSTLNRGIDKYSEEIKEIDDERKDCAAELKLLLKRRGIASASECLTLDGEINVLKAKYENFVFSIKRRLQKRADLVNKSSLVDKIKDNSDLNVIDKKISELSNGTFSDLGSLAMDINKTIEEDNKALEESNIASTVASSVNIKTDAMTGMSLNNKFETEVKDDDKFADLERELGLRD